MSLPFDKSARLVSAALLLKLLSLAVFVLCMAMAASADDIVFSNTGEKPSSTSEWRSASSSLSWPIQADPWGHRDPDFGTVWLTTGSTVTGSLTGTTKSISILGPATGGTYVSSLILELEALTLLGIGLVAVGLLCRRRISGKKQASRETLWAELSPN